MEVSAALVSPEFILRPSLSGAAGHGDRLTDATCVAGVYTPAFVERWTTWRGAWRVSPRVAGVYTPAFVERTRYPEPSKSSVTTAGVAGVYTPAFVERRYLDVEFGPRRGVAGVYTPAFVERR